MCLLSGSGMRRSCGGVSERQGFEDMVYRRFVEQGSYSAQYHGNCQADTIMSSYLYVLKPVEDVTPWEGPL